MHESSQRTSDHVFTVFNWRHTHVPMFHTIDMTYKSCVQWTTLAYHPSISIRYHFSPFYILFQSISQLRLNQVLTVTGDKKACNIDGSPNKYWLIEVHEHRMSVWRVSKNLLRQVASLYVFTRLLTLSFIIGIKIQITSTRSMLSVNGIPWLQNSWFLYKSNLYTFCGEIASMEYTF